MYHCPDDTVVRYLGLNELSRVDHDPHIDMVVSPNISLPGLRRTSFARLTASWSMRPTQSSKQGHKAELESQYVLVSRASNGNIRIMRWTTALQRPGRAIIFAALPNRMHRTGMVSEPSRSSPCPRNVLKQQRRGTIHVERNILTQTPPMRIYTERRYCQASALSG